MILVISNPVSGDGSGREFVRKNVLPLLEKSNQEYQLEETKAAGTAGRLAVDFLQKQHGVHATILVSGGDGTIHEVVNGIGLSETIAHNSSGILYSVCLVICPQGTANALYSTLFPPSNNEIVSTAYRLKSLNAFLNGTGRPLILTKTQLFASDGQTVETVLGIVVISTALHACILDSAEHLRTSVSGIERFKIAAAQNISDWYHSHVLLHPSEPSGNVRIFDPRLEAFKPLGSDETPEVNLSGPYTYFLSPVNVDRLEPKFEIAPLFTMLPPDRGEIDLIVIRPLRDPTVYCDTVESRANSVSKSSAVLQAVYNNGNHINLRYAKDGAVHSEGDGRLVVEYIRCGGWEWKPDGSDTRAHLICIDGTVLTIEKGGKATCRIFTDPRGLQFTVCA